MTRFTGLLMMVALLAVASIVVGLLLSAVGYLLWVGVVVLAVTLIVFLYRAIAFRRV